MSKEREIAEIEAKQTQNAAEIQLLYDEGKRLATDLQAKLVALDEVKLEQGDYDIKLGLLAHVLSPAAHGKGKLLNWRNKDGICSGKYSEDGKTAITNGNGVCLAISNLHLKIAVKTLNDKQPKNNGIQYYYPRKYVKCWVRPHEGPFNPNSIVDTETCANDDKYTQKK